MLHGEDENNFQRPSFQSKDGPIVTDAKAKEHFAWHDEAFGEQERKFLVSVPSQFRRNAQTGLLWEIM
ncbi:MAG: hypothetical protein WC840_02345 [Candidatus Peribacteraceae bacterium]